MKNKRKLKIIIDPTSIYGLILMLPFFEPASVIYVYPLLHPAFRFGRIVSTLLIFFILLFQFIRGMYRPGIPVLFTFFIFLQFAIANNSNGKPLNFVINSLITYTAVVAFTEYLVKKNLLVFLRAICPIFGTLSVINFITLFVFPNGMYSWSIPLANQNYTENWLLGHDNTFIVFLMPAMFFCIIRYYLSKEKVDYISCAIVMISAIITVYYRWSATTVVCTTVFLLILILSLRKEYFFFLGKIFNSYLCILMTALVFVSISLLQIQDVITQTILHVLGKSSTFSGRYLIWTISINSILKRFYKGYGYAGTDEEVFRNTGLNSTHNTYLWFWYIGGFFTLFTFLVYILIVSRRLYKYRNEKIIILATAVLFTFLLMWLFEAIYVYSEFVLLAVLYNISDDKLIKKISLINST